MFFQGFPGVGKSFTTKYVLEALRVDTSKVLGCAFTHAAKENLQNFLGIQCVTICSTLKCRMTKTEFNDAELDKMLSLLVKADKSAEETSELNNLSIKYKSALENQLFFKIGEDIDISDYQLIIIDEYTLLSSEYYLALELLSKDQNVPIIYIGDPEQLDPIGESKSSVESTYSFKLIKIIRFSGDILSLATDVRKNVELPVNFNEYTEDGSVRSVSSVSFNRTARKAFQENWKESIVIAPLRKTVFDWALRIRTNLYGEEADDYIIGEPLYANSPIFIGEKLVIENGSLAQISKVDRTSYLGFEPYLLQLADEGGSAYRVDSFAAEFMVLSETEMIEYLQLEDEIKSILFATPSTDGVRLKSSKLISKFGGSTIETNTDTRRKLFYYYWQVKQIETNLVYPYALTVHKAIGKTYKNVFLPNYRYYLNARQRPGWVPKKLFYTALTRASEQLIVEFQ